MGDSSRRNMFPDSLEESSITPTRHRTAMTTDSLERAGSMTPDSINDVPYIRTYSTPAPAPWDLRGDVEQMTQTFQNIPHIQPDQGPATSYAAADPSPTADVSYISPHTHDPRYPPTWNTQTDGPASSTFRIAPQPFMTPLPDVSHISQHSVQPGGAYSPQPLSQSIHSRSAMMTQDSLEGPPSPGPNMTYSGAYSVPSGGYTPQRLMQSTHSRSPTSPGPNMTYSGAYSVPSGGYTPQRLMQSTHSRSPMSPGPNMTYSGAYSVPSGGYTPQRLMQSTHSRSPTRTRMVNPNLSLPAKLRHPKKSLDRTMSSGGQRPLHPKVIEFRPKSSRYMKTRLSRTLPPTLPAPSGEGLNETEITEQEINDIISLSNQLSSTKLERNLSQMEINDLQQYARNSRERYIALLNVMLSDMTEINRLSAKEQYLINAYATGVVKLQELRGLLEGFEEPRPILQMLRNKIQAFNRLKPALESKVLSLSERILRTLKANTPEFMQEYNLKLEQANVLRSIIEQLKTQQEHIHAIRQEIKTMEVAERKLGHNYDSSIADELLEMDGIKARIKTLENGIKRLKGELGEEFGGPSKEIMDVLKHYFHAESYRKSLSYQKRWLLSLLNKCHKRIREGGQNDRLLFKHTEYGLNSRGLWKAGGFAVVAIHRLTYLVRVRTRLHFYEVNILRKALTSS